ncbi:MAG TPA: CpsB/CapC family capsule biosynthesis tyrosine phosphatase [Acidobacteriaceae bacterium]|nr:CpsB/CapC family capsule biosynthesis tyrosine phosphatase [Acidobacteriaceae bacterium]
MIDIHHHLLFGVDDGPKTLDLSVQQAELAAADGITHIVCTPHANHAYEFNPETNRQRLQAIRERIGDRLQLGLGCDFHLSYENIEDALEHPTKYTINNGRYLLVEFAEFMIPQNIGNIFYEFTVKGMRPIITHPERNPLLQRDSARMAEWMRTGCLVQVTAASLGDRFGKRAHAMVWELLEKNWVNFIATDAHNLDGRRPNLSAACEAVAKRLGEETARRLCVENPRAAFDNQDLPPQPEPAGVYVYEDEIAQRGGFFSRLFGR